MCGPSRLGLGCILPIVCAPAPHLPGSWLPCPRLAEKKASIGYTYEDSTVAEVEKVAEKPEEEESPAEEESNSDEDEVIPDIGGVPSLPSPPTVPGRCFRVSSRPLCGVPPCLGAPPVPPLLQGAAVLPSHSCPPGPASLSMSLSFLVSRILLL